MTQHSPALSARGLSVGYDRTPIVSELDLEIEAGRITALIGPNGSGKSTLLKGLARVLPPLAGHVELAGRDIRRISSRDVARELGFLPQSPLAPDGITVAELVRRGRHPHDRLFSRNTMGEAAAVAEAMLLTGVSEYAHRPVTALSGGQRQRAWIAMVLAQRTPTLLLDEPTTFLDIAHQIDVLELLLELNREHGKTIVIVLHDLEQAAAYADTIVALTAGAIAASGPPQEVVTERFLADVFGLTARVIPDPDTGSPLVLPRGRRSRSAAEDSPSAHPTQEIS